ncbi:MAG: bifunctional 5,10-methylenetetrahydrofolate dehydrogenase/5,10-methenyltetrahydrofolate cyclohydrolase [Patescibacteria group bacterium]
MSILIDGKAVAKKIERETAQHVKELATRGVIPKLTVVLVGDDRASVTYVHKKGQLAKNVGIKFELLKLPASITSSDLQRRLRDIQRDRTLSGLIIQLPLPEHLTAPDVLNSIQPNLDVDGLTDVSMGRLMMGTADILPPTPSAVMTILEHLSVDLTGKSITIVGTGALVGKPLSVLMMNANATVTTCNAATRNLDTECRSADILISAVGQPGLIRGTMIKKNAIVVDTGIAFVNGKMTGDVNVEEAMTVAHAVTPTPGGVGPITVARLLWNVVQFAKGQRKNSNHSQNTR